jgi:L-ribulose-5-phosphate 3-epimerase
MPAFRHKSVVESYGLQISAVCGDLGGHEFTKESDVEQRIARTKHIMNVTKVLDCEIVQTHIGTMPHDQNSPECRGMRYAPRCAGRIRR